MLRFVALRIAVWIAGALPLRFSYPLAHLGGVLAYYAWVGGRRRCIANMLRLADGDAALARRHARRSFAFYGQYLVDFLRMGRVTPAELEWRVPFDDWSLFEEARTGSGLILVTMHFGNWDMAAARVAGHLPVVALADRFDNPAMERLVVGTRERLGMRIIAADSPGPGILRALRRNEVVAVLTDVPQPQAGTEVEFFGGTIAIPDGPARIALRGGASVVTAMLAREHLGGERFTVALERVEYEQSDDADRDVQALTQSIVLSLERSVRRHPDQWYIFRSLWLEDMDVTGKSESA